MPCPCLHSLSIEGLTLDIEAERHHVSDLQASVARLHTQLSKIRDQAGSLDAELTGVRKDVNLERATKERQVKILGDMASTDDAHLSLLESALGLKVSGVGGEYGLPNLGLACLSGS